MIGVVIGLVVAGIWALAVFGWLLFIHGAELTRQRAEVLQRPIEHEPDLGLLDDEHEDDGGWR